MAPPGGEAARAAHWDRVYSRLGEERVSWFEATPTQSLELLDLLGARADEPLIDVGAGASHLVDALLERGFSDLTMLDVSAEGLELTRERLGRAARRVRWIVADALSWRPDRRYRTWHDRAMFHFLTEPADRARYLDTLDRALAPDGRVVLGTFADDGPRRCSGLPVARYSGDELIAALGVAFRLVTTRHAEQGTPGGDVRPYTWIAARRGTG